MAFANILRGRPHRPGLSYLGSFFNLLNPYALLGGGHDTAVVRPPRGGLPLAQDDRRAPRTGRTRGQVLAPAATVALTAFLAWTYVNAHNAHDTGLVPPIVPILAIVAVAVVGWLLREKP